eukprot:m.99184 g.99184  ORF g.99184 m.99184 type:complete len:529 (+) comp22156_c0_seq1:804-2390(+)
MEQIPPPEAPPTSLKVPSPTAAGATSPCGAVVDSSHFENEASHFPSPAKQPMSTLEDSTKPIPDRKKTPRSSPGRNPYREARKNRPPVTNPMAALDYHPIDSLHPYQKHIKLKVRVTSKPPVREWKNASRAGKVFSVDFLDETGEIRATGFNDVVDLLFDKLEVGKVYIIEGGHLRPANKRFCSINNPYELTLERTVKVTPCEDTDSLPQHMFHFTDFAQLQELPTSHSYVDIIGVVISEGSIEMVQVKKEDTQEVPKRDVLLKGHDSHTIKLTLWGESAQDFEKAGGKEGSIIALKSGRLSEFNGRTLSANTSSTVLINPDIPEARKLHEWYQREGKTSTETPLSVRGATSSIRRWLCELENGTLGSGEKPDYFETKATISYINPKNLLYKACPSNCKKRMTEEGPNMYHCEKCGYRGRQFRYRIMLTVKISDITGDYWVNHFEENAKTILHKSAEELGAMHEQDEKKFEDYVEAKNFQTFVMVCRAKLETWQDEQRIRLVSTSVKPVNYKLESELLLADIRKELGA